MYHVEQFLDPPPFTSLCAHSYICTFTRLRLYVMVNLPFVVRLSEAGLESLDIAPFLRCFLCSVAPLLGLMLFILRNIL